MNILSLGYLMFLIAGGIIYYLLPSKSRWKWLIVLSFLFVFSSSAVSSIFIIATSVCAYISAKKIAATDNPKKKKRLLLSSLVFCVGILVVLKYISDLNIFQHTILFDDKSITIQSFIKKYLLPIGISYYTLQVISYILDVYWERIEPEKSYLKILLFTCYFPQMVQGPISKYSELAPELFKEHKLDWHNIKFGVQLMLWGFFKKMVIADPVGIYVNKIFYNDKMPYGLVTLVGLILYGIQLYSDFSGGIDIIRGTSKCFDIGMKDNFRQPYFSLSLGEFWRRWHISLGEWMKDYVFFPINISEWMGKIKKYTKKHASRKTATNVGSAVGNIVVFTLVGIWHGTGTNFLGWGLYNGIILAVSALLVDKYALWKKKLNINIQSMAWKSFCLLRTLIIITVGWVFDCAPSMTKAGQLFMSLFYVQKTDLSMIATRMSDIFYIMMFLCACIILLVVDIMHEKDICIREKMNTKGYWIQVIFWTVLIQLIVFGLRFGMEGGFMYENF